MYRAPLFPEDELPVLRTISPLEPALPELAVLMTREPLLVPAELLVVSTPVMTVIFPPEFVEAAPELNTI
jgi:hypothetical protein